jgi:hypothetical protein
VVAQQIMFTKRLNTIGTVALVCFQERCLRIKTVGRQRYNKLIVQKGKLPHFNIQSNFFSITNIDEKPHQIMHYLASFLLC